MALWGQLRYYGANATSARCGLGTFSKFFRPKLVIVPAAAGALVWCSIAFAKPTYIQLSEIVRILDKSVTMQNFSPVNHFVESSVILKQICNPRRLENMAPSLIDGFTRLVCKNVQVSFLNANRDIYARPPQECWRFAEVFNLYDNFGSQAQPIDTNLPFLKINFANEKHRAAVTGGDIGGFFRRVGRFLATAIHPCISLD